MEGKMFLMAVLPMVAWAADQAFDIKPGLWDITSTVQMSGLPPIPNLDQMPPEQRARIEAAMKKMSSTGNTNTVKSCITREGIGKAIADANKGHTCKPKLAGVSASKVELHIECTEDNGEMKATANGDMTISRRDSEHFTGSGAIKTTGSNGRSIDMKWSTTGSFVTSDCGNVKPAGQ